MAGRLVRVFSSAANLEEYDEQPFVIPREIHQVPHALDDGAEYFDAQGAPVRPPPQTIKKNFSGSSLDLDSLVPETSAGKNMSPQLGAGAAATESFDSQSPTSATGTQSSPQPLRGVVALIGGTHYLNGHIAALLLERGYLVHVIMQDAPPVGSLTRSPSKTTSAVAAAAATPSATSATGNKAGDFPSTLAAAPASPAGAASSLPPTSSSSKPSSGSFASTSSNVSVQQAAELLALAGAHVSTKNRLHVSEGTDMFNANSLRDALRKSGCRYIIHGGVNTANLGALSAQRIVDMHRAAVVALFQALSGLRAGSVERVVITSTAAAVAAPDDACPAKGFDETCFNTRSTAAEEPVAFAKAHFESEVWRLRLNTSVDFTVLVPTVMLGPSRTSESSDAMRVVCDFARSSSYIPFAPNMYWNFVDVRDVALAHVMSLDAKQARNRRYIVTNSLLSLVELGKHIRMANMRLKAPVYTMPTLVAMLGPMMPGSRVKYSYLWTNLGVKRPMCNTRLVQELGLQPRPFDQTVKDSIAELAEQGLLPEATGAVDADWEATRSALVVGGVAALFVAGYYLWRKSKNGTGEGGLGLFAFAGKLKWGK